jgi:TatD DNase family protein
LLVDTHCHLNLDAFTGDLEEVIRRSLDAGISKIIVPGVDQETSRMAIELSSRYDCCFAAVGIHPNYAASANPQDITQIKSLASEPKVVAIGEIGLDLYRDYAPLNVQSDLLSQMLYIAKEKNLPLIIHSRSAVGELLRILKTWFLSLNESHDKLADAPGVMHAFEGSLEEAEKFREMGFAIGLGGAWTYDPSRVDQNILTKIPFTSFVFETDSPYLTPVPWRGKRNEPAFLAETVQCIAQKTGMNSTELCKISTNTAKKIFSLELI